MQFGASIFYKYRRFVKWLSLYLALAGPGIIVMVADNDAGGITTYAATGAKFGFNLIWFVILLGPAAFAVQEMCVRLGAVTKRGHAEAIFDAFGPFWGWFSLIDLGFLGFLTLISEFVGMTAAMSIFGVPPVITVIGVSLLMIIIVMHGRYWTWEKIVLLFCGLNLIYIPATLLLHPDFSKIGQAFIPSFPNGISPEIFFFLMANIGTTIAPWMLFFHQSSVVDKGLTEKDIPFARWDTLIGSIFVICVAAFVMILTGTLLYRPPNGVDIENAALAAESIMESYPLVGAALAIGLFDAGLLGAICISLASSWAMGEVFGWAHSINNKITEAPMFYAFYFLSLVFAGIVVLIPGAPLVLITLFVQVIAVTLLPAALVFLILLLNQEELMGRYRNTLLQNIIGLSIVGMIVILSTLYAISVLFPEMFQ
jgi:NRAMP (natural resistance-associated macrophage protein)-like metal ion transporter